MSGLEIAMIISSLAGGIGGLMGGGEGQELKSFDSEVYSTNPLAAPNLAKKGLGNLDNVFGMAMERAGQGVDLSGAFAQAPPTFSGGGLPMPIGVTGRDPFPGGRRGVGLRQPPPPPRRERDQILPGTQGPGGRFDDDIEAALAGLQRGRTR